MPGAVLQVLSLERQAEAATARIGHGADVEVGEGDSSTGPEPFGGKRPTRGRGSFNVVGPKTGKALEYDFRSISGQDGRSALEVLAVRDATKHQ